MQRFKKEVLSKYPDYSMYVGQLGINEHAKFTYGANGTLTQAARWRREAMNLIGEIRDMHPTEANVVIKSEYGGIRSLLGSASRGGCRLP